MIFCSEAAEWFFFDVLSTAKEKLNISAISVPQAQRVVKLFKPDHNPKNETII
jgi:hypothetical protein